MTDTKTGFTPMEMQDIVARADEMMCGQFRFDGVWDMEPCPEPVDNRGLDWDIRYNGDEEWAYMFTRMDWLYKLALASQETGKPDYYRYGLRIIDKWYRDNRMYLKGGVANVLRRRLHKGNCLGHRTLDISILASNIADYAVWGVEHGFLSDGLLPHYRTIVTGITDYVFRNSDGEYKSFSNWGIQENGNMVYSLLRLGSDRHLPDAGSRLVRQVRNQILSDGSQIESSPMYLVEILLVLLKVMKLDGEGELRDQLIGPVTKGCEYIRSIRTLDNCIPSLGDSDHNNISDLMLIAADVLNRDDYRSVADRPLNPEYCFKYRMERTPQQGDCDNNGTEKHTFLHQTVYRSAVEGFHVLCSNTPRGRSGHKHYDYLSILWSEFGKDVLVDAGRYTYRWNDQRRFNKGPQGHNTIAVPDGGFYRCVTSWATSERIDSLANRVEWADGQMSVRMQCVLGYGDVLMSRYVTYINNVGLLVTDMIQEHAGLAYKYETYFNIGHDFVAECADGAISIHDDEGHTLTYGNDRSLKAEIKPIQISRRYNEQEESSQMTIKTDGGIVTHSFLKSDGKVTVSYSDETIEYDLSGHHITVRL